MSLLEPSTNASKHQLPYLAIAYNAGYHLEKTKEEEEEEERSKHYIYIRCSPEPGLARRDVISYKRSSTINVPSKAAVRDRERKI
jgi:hypothetical protein